MGVATVSEVSLGTISENQRAVQEFCTVAGNSKKWKTTQFWIVLCIDVKSETNTDVLLLVGKPAREGHQKNKTKSVTTENHTIYQKIYHNMYQKLYKKIKTIKNCVEYKAK